MHAAIIFLFLCTLPFIAEAVVVRTNRGRIRGYTSYEAGADSPVHVFKAIPFIKPPLGELRFRLPEDPLPWDGILDATAYSAACMSNSTRTSSPQKWISEDCLYLNVFADARCFGNRSRPCPVIPYIHGGSFLYGSAVMFNDSQIIRKYASREIVFVIPAFRLGVFGFLDFGNDDTVTRNLGLYDFLHALKWIKQEIHNFGGDPDQITLFGSSGGASVIVYLTMSPAVPRDYFHKAIALSNSPYMCKDLNLNVTTRFLNLIGCSTGSAHQMVACLREKSASELMASQRELEVSASMLYMGVESDSLLLPGNYSELITNSSPRPILLGQTQFEMSKTNEPHYEHIYCSVYCEQFGYYTQAALDECVGFYTNKTGEYSGDYTLEAVALHALNYRDALQWTSMNVPVYLTSFNLKNHSKHSMDMLFAIGLHYEESVTDEERFMDEYYPQILVNFVKNGKPGNDWSPLNKDGSGYYIIDAVNNGSQSVWPHPVNSYFYPQHVHFWLSRMASVDAEAAGYFQRTQLAAKPNSFHASAFLFAIGAFFLLVVIVLILAFNQKSAPSRSDWGQMQNPHYGSTG